MLQVVVSFRTKLWKRWKSSSKKNSISHEERTWKINISQRLTPKSWSLSWFSYRVWIPKKCSHYHGKNSLKDHHHAKKQGCNNSNSKTSIHQWLSQISKHLFKSIIFDCDKEIANCKFISNEHDINIFFLWLRITWTLKVKWTL